MIGASNTRSASVVPNRSGGLTYRSRRHAPALIAGVVFCLLFVVSRVTSYGPLTYFDISFLASGGTALALAAIGQTLVILSGGFDLSAGAVVSLVNAVLAANMDPADLDASVLLWSAIGIGTGMLVGAFNGFFVAVLRLQPIVVTLSTMFIVQGITLLVLPGPGGFVSPSIGSALMGDAVPGLVPASLALIGGVLLLWAWLKRTPYGIALYAVGGDPESAVAVGLPVVRIRFTTYVLAGGLYGLAGVFVSAQTGSGDPLIGDSLLLSMFAAVVIGGTRLGGGRGGPTGTVFGAFILIIIVNILLTLNVSAYYSTIAEGAVLLLAVLAGSVSKDSVLRRQIRALGAASTARRAGRLVHQRQLPARRLDFASKAHRSKLGMQAGWGRRHGTTLRHALPAWGCLALVLILTQLVLGNALDNPRYWDSLFVLSCFLVILALGQGTVILTGGLDLSLPWTIGLSGVLLTGLAHGADPALVWAVPVVLAVAAFIGLLNGLGIVALGLSPIVVTLAMNGILQGVALLYTNGTPAGFAPPALRWLMTGRVAGLTPVLIVTLAIVAFGTVLLGRTAFGRRVYSIGNSVEASRLSGVRTGAVLICVYVVSALCAAVVGILLTGFSGQASLGMGNDYLLPSIAVVVVGGALITGGRGHYLGMVGGALLLTALQTLLAGTSLPYATRAILFGSVVLLAVIALREPGE